MILLRYIARGSDILISGDCDEMLSRESVMEYDPYRYDLVSTELRSFYFYFNRRAVYDYRELRGLGLYFYFGVKMTTVDHLYHKFHNLSNLRQIVCNQDVSSRVVEGI